MQNNTKYYVLYTMYEILYTIHLYYILYTRLYFSGLVRGHRGILAPGGRDLTQLSLASGRIVSWKSSGELTRELLKSSSSSSWLGNGHESRICYEYHARMTKRKEEGTSSSGMSSRLLRSVSWKLGATLPRTQIFRCRGGFPKTGPPLFSTLNSRILIITTQE